MTGESVSDGKHTTQLLVSEGIQVSMGENLTNRRRQEDHEEQTVDGPR